MFEGLLQPTHLLLIPGIALIVLGPSKLGDLGGQLGRVVHEFKQNVEGNATAPALTAGGTRFCRRCGAGNEGASRFCAECDAAAARPTA